MYDLCVESYHCPARCCHCHMHTIGSLNWIGCDSVIGLDLDATHWYMFVLMISDDFVQSAMQSNSIFFWHHVSQSVHPTMADIQIWFYYYCDMFDRALVRANGNCDDDAHFSGNIFPHHVKSRPFYFRGKEKEKQIRSLGVHFQSFSSQSIVATLT